MSKAKTAAKPGRTKTFNGTLPRGIKASQAISSVAGVTLRTDGQLRWEARIRRSLNGQALKFPLVRYPIDPKASPNTEHHIDAARLMAEAYVRREHASLELRQTPYAHTAEAWT
ncbi:integrase, partial [Xanthomonas hortorum pv. gardneri]